ncbi:hypothetical protein DU508_05285 [Pedobacter chinensis]|uniref:Dihydrodipicolinate synthase family protein n=1 Tax=Pedobacter chinensis TaxID=2282421 RepID=A0A369Q4Z1_9SPHI|nr:dihydrodipicolinate synthase family protein [Pedobacter chinensis]RDC58347.1 hypothetical protein DU508_05285 [Pedobacter chinensis]
MNIKSQLQGFIATAFTPLNEDRTLNLSKVPEYYRFLKQSGVSGILILANSEDEFLTIEEKLSLATAWRQIAINDQDFVTLLFICENSVEYAAKLVRHAYELKMSGIVIGFPENRKFGKVEHIVKVCQEILSKDVDMPVYFNYVETGEKSLDLDVIDLIGAMEKNIPFFTGIRFKSRNLQDFFACKNYKNGEYDLIWDAEEIFLPALSLGIKTSTGTQFNYLAPVYERLIKAFKDGDHFEAIRLEGEGIEFARICKKYGPGAGKAYLKLRGIDCGPLKLPFEDIKTDQFMNFFWDLDRLNFFSNMVR